MVNQLYTNNNPNNIGIQVVFYDAKGVAVGDPVTNFTEFNIERNFFVAPDAFTLVLEDDRAKQLSSQLFGGMAVELTLTGSGSNGGQLLMLGYIFNYHYNLDRTSHGQKLVISGQDLLGWLNKAVCLPNLGNAALGTNFHFKADDTFPTIMQTIFDAAFANNIGPISAVGTGFSLSYFDPKVGLQNLATGGEGLKQGKGRNISKSMNRALNHLSSSNMGETYLGFALRIAKHFGQNIKMQQGSTYQIQIGAPTYNLDNSNYNFRLTHSLSDPTYNNILEGGINLDVESQPSAIIVEKATSGNNFFWQGARKCVVVNEISGYPPVPNGSLQRIGSGGGIAAGISANFSSVYPIDNVNQALSQLISQYNYIQLTPNQQLYSLIQNCGISLVNTTISSPEYLMDLSAHSDEELQFAAALRMAEAQDKYLVLNYVVDGFFQKDGDGDSYLWQTDAMCQVDDEALGISGLFWIKKVNYSQNRSGGTHTYLELTLPYTHLGLESIEQQKKVPATPTTTPPDFNKHLYINGKIVTGYTKGPSGEWIPSTTVVGTPNS
jgi:hypothetical protein